MKSAVARPGLARRGAEMALTRPHDPIGHDLRNSGLWLAAVTLVAFVLRVQGAGSDLWLDEITTVLDCRNASVAELLSTFTFAGRHLLNSLSIKLATELFGTEEWAVRLPAILFGVAGVPAIYGLARQVFHRREAMFTAILLATSYHHVFFSQNARGYTGFLLFSTLGTTFLLRALERGAIRDWAAYVAAMGLAGAAMVLAFFVAAGHCVTVAVACWASRRAGRSVGRPLARAVAALAVVAALWILLYSPVLLRMFGYAGSTYRAKALGFAPFSLEHLREWLEGAAAGFGAGVLLGGLLAAALASVGLLLVARRRPLFTLTLLAPLVVLGAYQILAGQQISPRFFIWILPVGCVVLTAVASLPSEWSAARFGARPWGRLVAGAAPLAMIVLVVTASSISLWRQRGIPKQASRQSLEWLAAHRAPGEPIAVAHLARWGVRFYGPGLGLQEGEDFILVTSASQLEALQRERPVWVVSTFHRALRLEHPDLLERLRTHFELEKEFPATVGNAEVRVWREKAAPANGVEG